MEQYGEWIPVVFALAVGLIVLGYLKLEKVFIQWSVARDREARLWELAEERVQAEGLVFDHDGVIGCPTCGPNHCGQCGDRSPLVGMTVMQLKESIEHG